MKEFNELGEPVEAPKKKKWGFFSSYAKDGKGVKKEDVITNYNLINFFKLYARRFSKLVWVNALYIVGNFPLIFLMIALSNYFSKMGSSPASELYSVINGIGTASGGISGLPAALLGIHGGMSTIFSPTVVTYILYAIASLFIFTFGPVNAGCAYLVKNLIKGEPVFLWQDFITTIKRNWKQALPMGILDLVVIGMCAFSLMSYYVNYTRYYFMFWTMLLIIMLYAFIRFYLYNIMVTFELSFFQIIKNSVIFCLLGFGRNFIMFSAICGMIFLVVWLGTIFLPLFVISLFILIFATSTFMGTYAAYPKIKQYMIDPYYTQAEQDGFDDEE